ncbi:DUF1833 family protein [Microvirga massiliensis]|uniref:DUF1833 family protein n=1 Tax=Microvirga massiliensis TaxID=1033741 RepID=UPI00062BCC1E|nr:DUF1833 family protein [Microvirga massiliensis]
MSLTDAIQEAYADPDIDDVIIDTIELDHASFAEPVRIVCNVEQDMDLPINDGGLKARFIACGVKVTLQGFDDDGPTTGQLAVDNVSKLLQPHLKAAVKAGLPLNVTYRGYTVSDLSRPGEVRGGLMLSKVSLGPTSATGTLETTSKADRQAFPRLTYSLADYPALHGL